MKADAIFRSVWALALALLACAGTRDAAVAAAPRYTLAWTQRTDVGSPGPRYGHALAYDSDRGVTVFFGGEYSLPGGDPEYFNDTWEYDGVSWKRITIEGPVPEPRSRHAMCYDNVLKRVILFGGHGGVPNDVWNYESTGPQRGRWIRRITSGGPGPLAAHTMIFDFFAGRAIVAGGKPLDSEDTQTSATWDFDNALGLWSLRRERIGFRASGLGEGLTDHMMLYDYRRRDTVVMGGIGPFGTKLAVNRLVYFVSTSGLGSRLSCGSPVLEGSLIYDGFHDIYFDFGGNDYGSADEDPEFAVPNSPSIWYPGLEGFPCSYDPGQITVTYAWGDPVHPARRTQTAMIYDEKRRVTVLFGGVGGTRYGDTWELVTRDTMETWVQFNHQGRELGTFEFPYRTLARGVAQVAAGGALKIKSGSTPETPTLTRAMTIDAVGGPVSIGRP